MGNKLFYIIQYIQPQVVFAHEIEVYEYDLISDTNTLLYRTDDSESLWLNELRADEEKLYWTRLGRDNLTLESFCLKNREMRKIYSVSRDKLIVLGGNNGYLSWYEYDPSGLSNCKYYDLADMTVSSIIREAPLFFDTYARPSIHGTTALILEDERNEISFSLVDIQSGHIEKLLNWAKMDGCVVPQVSNNYVIWRDKYGGTIVYIYDIELEQTRALDFAGTGIESIFSIDMCDDILYINTSREIWYLDLKLGVSDEITKDLSIDTVFSTKELGTDVVFSLSKVSFDKQYISLFRNYSDYYAYIVRPPKWNE